MLLYSHDSALSAALGPALPPPWLLVSQVVCLSQSSLAIPNSPVPSVRDGSFAVSARSQALGALALQGDDKGAIELMAVAMHQGVSNVRRARQQARLMLAQQLCHEKKLSLLKTRHMIELLHKSQEMFFEAVSAHASLPINRPTSTSLPSVPGTTTTTPFVCFCAGLGSIRRLQRGLHALRRHAAVTH